jgi:hypothetical protein
MSNAWKDKKCPGSGQLPSRTQQFGTGDGAWEWGNCAVCGRPWCSLTNAGKVRAHMGGDDAPRVDLILTTLRSAQTLIDSALQAVAKLQPDYFCTMNADCPNR